MNQVIFLVLGMLLTSLAEAKTCVGYGPQTPRDLSSAEGTNKVKFHFAPKSTELNLCNIHFHKNAEHKASGFSISGGKGMYGGWKCNSTESLDSSQLAAPKVTGCKNVKPGDTIEVHWVHSSCQVSPGEGLGSCLSKSCANPQLRVETKVFLLVNDKKASKFSSYSRVMKNNGFHQPAALPEMTDAVQFLGSTTGPKFSDSKCSPLQVTWNVSPSCELLDINSLHEWCQKNPFKENRAHGVRALVTAKELLSEIK